MKGYRKGAHSAAPSTLLLLAAPTWLWGRCGRHSSPLASSVMDLVCRVPMALVSWLTQSSHLCCTLYTRYVNDIVKSLSDTRAVLFADDIVPV